jgi:hypothetical protein
VIEGYFDRTVARPLPRVRVGLQVPSISSNVAYVEFVLDTGAAFTCVHPFDATGRLGLVSGFLDDPVGWPRSVRARGTNGVGEYFPQACTFLFWHENEGRVQAIDGELLVARRTPHNRGISSLLGWNLLQHFSIDIEYRGSRVRLL